MTRKQRRVGGIIDLPQGRANGRGTVISIPRFYKHYDRHRINRKKLVSA